MLSLCFSFRLDRSWGTQKSSVEIRPTKKTTARHPLGISTTIQRIDSSSVPQFVQSSLAVAQVFCWNAVSESSRYTYQTGWEHWLRFTTLFGTDSVMEKISVGWEQLEELPPYSYQVACILSYMAFLRQDVKVEPGTVGVYLSGTRFMLNNCNVDTSFIDRSQFIKSTRRGMHVAFRAVEGNSKKDRTTLPFTVDMILYAIDTYLNTSQVYGLGVATAIVLAFVCLLRISEYTISDNVHYLRAEDVIFVVSGPSGGEVFIPSSEAHRFTLDVINEVIVTVRSAKNDAHGEGHRFCFKKNSPDSGMAFDLLPMLFNWAAFALPTQGRMFFSSQSKRFELTPDHINKTLKRVAMVFGFKDGSHFSSHSLRIGGASALAAANVPDYIIQKKGRWKSLAFLQYIRLASKAFNDAILLMCNVSTLTSNDIKKVSATFTVV